MRTRHVIGLILSALTVPMLVLGLLDPMEGGLAMLAAGTLLLVTWLVSRVPVPRLEWIAWVATVALAAVTIAVAGLLWNADVTGPGRGLPWYLWAMIIGYEAGVLVTLAGGVMYVVRQARELRHDHGMLLPHS
jgi:hypothetical protein